MVIDKVWQIKMACEDRVLNDQRPKIDCLLFDLDDTLYPLSSGFSGEILKNIGDYLIQKLGVEESKVPDMCDLLYKNYGTTMAGLRAIGYTFDYEEYYSFVHGRLPYEKIKPDPVLRHLLLSLPIRKAIFTNSDKIHTAKVLNRLGVEDCFEGIICFETLNPPMEATRTNIFDIIEYSFRPTAGMELPETPILCKPSEYAIKQALNVANVDPLKTIFFDDSVRNIQAAKRIGLHTALVGSSHRVNGADHALESIHKIRDALPELWGGSGEVIMKCPLLRQGCD